MICPFLLMYKYFSCLCYFLPLCSPGFIIFLIFFSKILYISQTAHFCNPSTKEAEARDWDSRAAWTVLDTCPKKKKKTDFFKSLLIYKTAYIKFLLVLLFKKYSPSPSLLSYLLLQLPFYPEAIQVPGQERAP